MRAWLLLISMGCTREIGDVKPGHDDVPTDEADTDVAADTDVVVDTPGDTHDTDALADTDVPPPEPTLIGAVVSFTTHCCSYPPTASNQNGTGPDVTVSDVVEYPHIGTPLIIDSNVDVSASAIDIVYTTNTEAATGTFNGFVYQFAGTTFTRITDATMGPLSSDPTQGRVRFTDRAVLVDAAGMKFVPGTRISIELVLQ